MKHLRSSSYYEKIRLLLTDLDSAATITKRREAGEHLISFLKNRQNRIGLAEDCIRANIQQQEQEQQDALLKHLSSSSSSSNNNNTTFSTGSNSTSSLKKKQEDESTHAAKEPWDPLSSLKQVVGHVIQTTIKASQKTLTSKSKLTVQDASFVHKVLLAIDGPMSYTTTSSSSSSSSTSNKNSNNKSRMKHNTSHVVHQPFTFDTFDRYRNTHVGMTLLSSTNVQNILSYILTVLDDAAMYSMAEAEWLDLLKTLCTRVDYVCHFRLSTDYNLIFNHIQTRLLYWTPEDDDDNDDAVVIGKKMISSTASSIQRRQQNQIMTTASKIFHGLLIQSVVKLKLDMQIYLRPCLRVVADWTRKSYSIDDSVGQNLFLSIVPLIAAYVESSVCVLADDTVGYPIWEYAIKWWDRTPLSNSRDALVDYFSAHLLVCEIAGRLEGLLPGDLGYVGSVSLDENKMNHLRCRILSEKTLLSYVSGYLANNMSTLKNLGAVLIGKKSKSSTKSPYNSLNRRERRYLELCARLLRCSQRIFLAKAEYEKALDRDALDQFTDNGLNSEVANVSDDLYQGSSPWIEYVISPICSKNIEPYMASFSDLEKSEGKSFNSSQNPVSLIAITCATFPTDPLVVVGYLQLIAASTELFLRGECWSSTNRWTHTNFCPYSNSLEGSMGVESFCSIGTCQDLARVIRLITCILEHYAGISGAETVQAWALICLLKLTESTIILNRYVQSVVDVGSESLSLVWRSTWMTLFRTELRYTSCTVNLSTGSLGELVVMLLTEIIQGECTDLHRSKCSSQLDSVKETHSFLDARQDDICNLPMYKSVENITTSLAFELISSLLSVVDLREGPDDSFYMALCVNKDRIKESSENISIRSLRIAMFCICVLEVLSSNNLEDTLQQLSPYIASCLSALIGNFISLRTSYRVRSLGEYRCTEDCVDSQDLIHFSKRNPSCTSAASKIDLALLWCDIISPFGELFGTVIDAYNWRGLNDLDLRLTPSWGAEDRNWSSNRIYQKCASTRTSTRMRMRNSIYLFTISHLKRLTIEFGLVSSASLLPLLKCTVSFYLSLNHDIGLHHELSDLFHKCIAWISSKYSSATDMTGWSFIAHDLIGLFRLLRSLYELNLGSELLAALKSDDIARIFNRSKKNIELFMKCRDPFIEAFNVLGYEPEDISKSTDEHYHRHGDESEQHTNDTDSVKGHKRPRLEISEALGRSLTKNVIVDTKDAWLSASLLLLIDPTCDSVQYILDSMIKPSDATKSTGKESLPMDSFDPHDSFMIVALIMSFVSPSNSQCLSLCSDMIVKGRYDATTSCAFHFSGFLGFSTYLSRYMQVCSSSGTSCFSVEDYHKAMSILDPERSEVLFKDSVKISRRSLRDRPSLRAVQLLAVKECFMQGTNSFHERFDLTYAEAFVKPFLASIHAEVRAAAVHCLAAALSIFPSQDQIVRETLTLLCFEEYKSGKGENLGPWILRIASQGQNKTIQSQSLRDAWNDSLQSEIFHVFECLGTIGALVSDEIRNDVLIDILTLCYERREWSALSLRSLNKISRRNQYDAVKDLVAYHSVLLIEYYLKTALDLTSLPIVYSYPSLLVHQNRLNLSTTVRLNVMSPSLDSTLDLQAKSFREFLRNHLSTIMPRIIVISPNQKSCRDEGKRSHYISEICMALYGDDAHIAKLIRTHLYETFSYITLIIESKTNTKANRASGLEAMDFISNILSKEKIDRYIAASCHLIIKKLVRLSGKIPTVYKSFTVDDEAYVRSIESVAARNSTAEMKVSPDINVYQRAGTTLTEIVIYALKDFGSAVNMIEKNQAWRSLRNICTHILSDINVVGTQVDPEVLLLIFKLLMLATDMSHSSMKLSILSQASLILDKVLEFEGGLIKIEDTDCLWKKIFFFSIQIHCDCVVAYTDACKESSLELSRFERCSGNLLSVVGEQRPVSRATNFDMALDRVDNLCDIIFLVHDVLLKIQRHATKYSYMHLLMSHHLPQRSLNRDETNSLISINEKFSLLSIIDNQRQKPVEDNLFDELNDLLNTLKSHHQENVLNDKTSRSSKINYERAIMQALERFMEIVDDAELLFAETEAAVVCKIRTELMTLCSAKLPKEIRVFASQCLGRLFRFHLVPCNDSERLDNGYEVMDSGLPNFYNDPLTHIHILALRLLAKYVQSCDDDMAIISIDTVNALLDTTSGQSSWSYVNDEQVKRIISPMNVSINRTSRVHPRVNGIEFNKLFERYSTDGVRDLSSLCWGKSLWSSSEKFDDWIRHITFTLITCCYGRDKESNQQSNSIRGSCDFFYPCANLCFTDANFAALIFPGIIYDLLNANKGGDHHTVKGSGTRRRESIGSPESFANQTLTKCITRVLNKADPEATELVVNVLNMLRRITEHRFLQSSHIPNSSISKERVYPDENNLSKKSSHIPVVTDENYNTNLQPNILWGGRQYGTVLQLNGLDVANAFVLIKRWEGALYYSEFYADNRLGTSGSLFEHIIDQNHVCGQFSISGFGTHIQDSDENISMRTARFCDLYKICLTQINEIEEKDGLLQQLSFLSSSLTGSFKLNDLRTLNHDYHGSETTKLLHYDAQMQTCRAYMDDYNVDNSSNIIACLNRLGVRHVLQNYITSVIDDNRDDENTKKHWIQIQDHFAEESWRMMLWSSIDGLQNSCKSYVLDKTKFSCNIEDESKGFNEYISDIAKSLLSDDQSSFSLLSSRCRINLCDAIDDRKGQRMGSRRDSERLVMQMNVLNDFDDISTVLFQQHDSLKTLISITDKWDQGMSEKNDALTFQDIDFLCSARELGLRILLRKKGINHDTCYQQLKSHLLRLCKISRQNNAPNIAETSLARLKYLYLSKCRESTLIDKISVALEEARITDLYGDSTLAITKTKAIINNLQDILRKEQNEEYKLLLAESCLQCGEWLMRTKSEASTSVLEKYLRPAATLSQVAYENNRNNSRAKLLSDAHFTLGDFAACSYDSLEAKMKTHDFKVALSSSSYRASELRECVSITDGLKNELEVIKSKLKGSSGSRKSATEQRDKDRYHDLDRKIHDLGQHMRTLEREIELETRERLAMEQNFNKYLMLAIQSYGTALSYCDTSSSHSTHVFRMMSLWFQTSTVEHDIHTVMADLFKKIPTFHFVPLKYQVFSRIDKSPPELELQLRPNNKPVPVNFQTALRLLVTRMCIDHPYHCLVQLLALSNGNKVQSSNSGKNYSALYLSNVGESKVEACKDILKEIRRDAPSFVSSLIDSYTVVMSSYYNLAMTPTDDIVNKFGYKDISIRDATALAKDSTILALDRCLGSASRKLFDCVPCILTKTPILRAKADYGGGTSDPIGSERIHSFESYFSLTESGIHRPKIVTCVGTSGKGYKQLVKGDDDIRQDAIMQQVFATINTLLRKNDLSMRDKGLKTKNQDLKIITYSCVPITPNSGIIEWVNDTIPFGDCLLDKKIGKQYQLGVHSKYYPGEWGNSLCRLHLKNSPRDQLRQSYDQICEHFSPAFRFFFLERFSHDLRLWYEARKRYIKSCAVNSIAGHVLGIGDRHALNILVHQKTGEIVHIDFGIVFEQGKLLPTPEIVPFRLTRDVVDGMGPLGTDGTFVATAVDALAVLRENTNALMTILSAVVSDPLYKWCINPLTARFRQRDELEEAKENTTWIPTGHSNNPSLKSLMDVTAKSEDRGTNIDDAASRTLAKIVKKLQGFEDESSGESQTVEGQVRMLIQAAKNPDNLCQMYCGWAPWL